MRIYEYLKAFQNNTRIEGKYVSGINIYTNGKIEIFWT